MRQTRIEKQPSDKARQEQEYTQRSDEDSAYEERRQQRYDAAQENRQDLQELADDTLTEIDAVLADAVGLLSLSKTDLIVAL
jgi:hypothetical protein